MSNMKVLDRAEKKRCKEKLEAINLLINDDPYSPNNAKKLHSDISQ